jgi:hypothetical protein
MIEDLMMRKIKAHPIIFGLFLSYIYCSVALGISVAETPVKEKQVDVITQDPPPGALGRKKMTVDVREAARNSVYAITCHVTLSTKTLTAPSTLTVNVPWGTAGFTTPGFAGSPTIAYNSATQLWEVTGLGTLQRVIKKTVNVPQSSQFYNKANTHEQVHYNQLDTGIASNYFTLNDLWQNHLQGLTSHAKGILNTSIKVKVHAFIKAEGNRMAPLVGQMEAGAYLVSDPISPQYIYQNCGRFP